MTACATCGHENVPGTLFCDECGHDLIVLPARSRPATAESDASARGTGDVSASAARFATAERATALRDASPSTPTVAAIADEPAHTVTRGVVVADQPDEEDAAAAAMAYLISESGRRLDVPAQDVVIVGREDMRSGIKPDVDLTLDGASAAGVSRRHCRLLHGRDGWLIEDLKSTNYTVLNGKAVPAHTPVPLRDGDELRLGKLRLRFHTT